MSNDQLNERDLTLSARSLAAISAGAGAAVARLSPASGGATVAEIESLYRAQAGAFVRFATAFLGDGELARDVVQEAFARALRNRESFRGDGTLEAWLWRTVVNTCRNARRARALRMRFSQLVDRDRLEPEQAVRSDAVLEAIKALPERQRTCVFLRYFADLDYVTIATALGISPGTVAATLHSAHGALRRHLEVRGWRRR